ncbi:MULTISPECIES: MFS transporter [unclassified Novosphingobium]|uniref:MFS transporter n=1 Tax=unclassified Novosphingobium TaxID=2644732 RepID=UPI0014416AF4|nr:MULTISPECIES: MFS transporter [unclassified Novosphingobium]MBB3358872.1 MFS family permease [Novosphingobium sp. BK256]MBB3375647.1 MFS family permease [Novosphingobium sp. BK280]MBB3379644.1 MFS family permease [Novosphingobium sp. BK258]MBB3421339.1 MFS family permease [Novosphingobium sp. BK267]MBB3449654.1 MFS family permease [Novosphingobium sp. BK352]
MSRLLHKTGLVPARLHLILIVAATFLALLVSAGLRATPGVLMVPLQVNFGWDRATISFAAAIGIFLYGLVGPFAAALMVSFGIRRTMLAGLTLMSLATFASLWMRLPWHYVLTWGVLSGIGSGAVASVLGAAVVNRWFATRQGLVMGLLSASTATGALIFLPLLAWLSRDGAWRPVVLAVSLVCLALVPLVALVVPEHPADIGTRRFGEGPDSPPPPAPRQARTAGLALSVLWRAARQPMFWLLFGTFFVCGLTTNGLVGTHMIAFCGDHGIAPVAAAGLLSTMGFFDLFGTTASGWLTDRYNPRVLLIVYYGLRGLSLLALPFLSFDTTSLAVFAVFYGLDWIATVPPTVKLANEAFGEQEAPIVFGWIQTGHQLGAAFAAFGAGVIRQQSGSYALAFVVAGIMGVVASLVLLGTLRRAHAAAGAPVPA